MSETTDALLEKVKKVLKDRDEARLALKRKTEENKKLTAQLEEYRAINEEYRAIYEAQENELDVLRGKVEMVELIFGKERDDG